MDRLKQALSSNTETLQQEVHEITIRLNNILKQTKKISREITSMPYNDFISNKDYCLKICSQQCNIINNLHAANIQLEEYQFSNKSSIKNGPKNKKKTSCVPIDLKVRDSSNVIAPKKDEEDTSTSSSTNNNSSTKNYSSTNNYSSEEIIDTREQSDKVNNLEGSIVKTLNQYGLLKQQKTNSKLTPDLTFKKSTIMENSSVASTSKISEYLEGNLKPPVAPYRMMSCLISHIVSPSEFYINYITENIEEIEKISTDYSTYHDSLDCFFTTKSKAKVTLKTYCLCYIDSWQFWFRAKIVDWLDDSDENVRVFLVDYGNTLSITFKNLRPLLKKYGDIPECAIRCHLAHLYPLGSTMENILTDWTQEAITGLKNILGPENQYFFNIVYVDRFNNSWGVDLSKTLIKTDLDNKCVGEQLLDNKLCVEIINIQPNPTEGFIQSQVETAQGFDGISSKMTDSEKLETFCRNLDLNEPGNLDEALTGYKAKDQARTCQVYLRHGSCYKLPNCRFDHEPLRKDGYTTDKVQVHIATTLSMPLPEEGATFQVRITSIVGLTRWYGNFSTKMTTFNQLSEQLNNPKLIQKYQRFTIEPSIGELVIVKIENSADPTLWKWYRGQVQDVRRDESSPEDIVTVFLVDVGELIQTTLFNLRIITKDLVYLPFQAVLLRIHGVKEKENVCKDDVVEYCKENFVGRNLSATVLQRKPDQLVVSMGQKSKRQGNLDVAQLIVQSGYGVRSEDDVCVNNDNSLKYELYLD